MPSHPRRFLQRLGWPALRVGPSITPYPKRPFQPRIESLEDRCLLSILAVTSTAADGQGSLRQAILDALDRFFQDFATQTPSGGGHSLLLV